jgi:deoxyribodipyrimidine photo-lyase
MSAVSDKALELLGDFPPTPEAARARLAAVRPAEYARSRNHLLGAVTRLSPYLTHGLLTLTEVVETLRSAHRLPLTHKLMQELGWRAFFHHAWRHDGVRILQSLHPGPLPDAVYSATVPEDVREGATGVAVIDQAVNALYATGYLHNHARMWLASYLVHVRKVHWRPAADWMFAHLLDGDLGSNHLSWQWVAGTASAKPYLFNADNVAKHAPTAWHSFGTAIDRPYAALDALARRPEGLGAEPGTHLRVSEPPLFTYPPEGGYANPDPALLSGRDVWLVHPWSLADPPSGWLPVAVLDADWHVRWPWSARRWAFVSSRMYSLTALRWWAPAAELIDALRAARRVGGWYDLHWDASAWAALQLPQSPTPWPEPAGRCRSFSAYWATVARRGTLFPSSRPPPGEPFHG